jgi:hypothetical protein
MPDWHTQATVVPRAAIEWYGPDRPKYLGKCMCCFDWVVMLDPKCSMVSDAGCLTEKTAWHCARCFWIEACVCAWWHGEQEVAVLGMHYISSMIGW